MLTQQPQSLSGLFMTATEQLLESLTAREMPSSEERLLQWELGTSGSSLTLSGTVEN